MIHVCGIWHTQTKQTNSGLDQVLSDIKGPQSISTVLKSSVDWENYKEEEGLQDQLVEKKDGYLSKKDFLNRCDVREYEVDRGKRVLAAAGRKG